MTEGKALCMQLLAVEPAQLGASSAPAPRSPGSTPPRLPDIVVASPPVALAPSPVFVGRQRELADLAEVFAGTRAGTEAIVLVEEKRGFRPQRSGLWTLT